MKHINQTNIKYLVGAVILSGLILATFQFVLKGGYSVLAKPGVPVSRVEAKMSKFRARRHKISPDDELVWWNRKKAMNPLKIRTTPAVCRQLTSSHFANRSIFFPPLDEQS